MYNVIWETKNNSSKEIQSHISKFGNFLLACGFSRSVPYNIPNGETLVIYPLVSHQGV